ncbi:class II fructose-bisphosphate aldolase [Thioclava sp. 15-R06ZXC-3]|uniref:Class II fructose-bisphosphate aldolase n=1 Tax=Thioclava arctica TaxID=3238301 RepID=A0ABV3TQP5_9RHOB
MQISDHMKDAVEKGYALAAFNAPSFDAMSAIAKAAKVQDKPVIIQTSARLVKQHTADAVGQWFRTAKKIWGAQCYLHLDHCVDLALISDCIDAGWDMVMFDGSHFEIGKNIDLSQQVSAMAHRKGVAVEGEIGCIGGEEDGLSADANYANPDETARLVAEGGLDCIAVGFGNVHGDYETKANLRWDIYEAAYDVTGLPLVLHGGSGLTDAEFARAIRAKSAKVNISTDLKKAYVQALESAEMKGKILSAPSAVHDAIFESCFDVAGTYINKFNPTEGTL